MPKLHRFQWQFLKPKFWGIWLGYFLLWTLSLTPYKAKFWVGKKLGQLLYSLFPSRRRLAEKNIALCFPDKPADEREKILKGHFESLGINLMETGINLWGSHRTNLKDNESKFFSYHGLEHLDQDHNQGVILVVPHFTTIEMTGLMMSFITPYRPIYRPHDNPLMEYLITSSRTTTKLNEHKEPYVQPISNKDTRTLVKHLKAGKVLMILPDQKYGGPGSIEVPFFGYATPSNPGINKLAKLGNAKVMTVFTRRLGHHYELTINPPLEHFPSGDDYQDTLRLHQLYEAEIRQNPTQYLWTHDRWDIKNRNPHLPKTLFNNL